MMRSGIAILVLSAFALVAASITPATAAKKTRDECLQLAKQRGFDTSGQKAQIEATRAFVKACMEGKQQ